jgi:putative tricarboxylic transport membrane protein
LTLQVVRLQINVPDLAFAVFLVALGALAFVLAGELTVGTAAAMGPGYVPRGLALIVMVYGAVLGVRAAFSGRLAFPAIALRPLLLVSASVALFAILLPFAGLALTSFAIVLCAGFAAYDVRLRENVISAAVLAVFAIALFVSALGLPIPVWPG